MMMLWSSIAMGTINRTAGGLKRLSAINHIASQNSFNLILRFVALAVIDAFALWFVIRLTQDKNLPLAALIAATTVGINAFYLHPRMGPFRWFSPGLALMILMVLYPTLFTVYVAFTNWGTGNLLSKTQVIEQLESRLYAPEGSQSYQWTGFVNEAGEYKLWLISDDGSEAFLARPNEALIPAAEAHVGELDADGVPLSIEGFERIERNQVIRHISALGELTFGDEGRAVQVTNTTSAAELRPKFTYDAARDVIVDLETGKEFTPIDGTFTADDGEQLSPGFFVPVGFRNFNRLINSAALRGAFSQVFVWTFVHAIGAVFLQFVVGLGLALLLNDAQLPGMRYWRTLILIPYAVPTFISMIIWRGMFVPGQGIISTTLTDIFGSSPAWFGDGTWAKIGILIVQMWIGFPYMMLISLGALQSIPSDIYEAAKVDGANAIQRFFRMTLPLLLITLGPLLIASFAFNFNNFNIIRIYNQGGPPIAGAPIPTGQTDILISYTFRVAFSDGGSDFGFASTITIVIFIVVALVTLFNFRFTRAWEEAGENV